MKIAETINRLKRSDEFRDFYEIIHRNFRTGNAVCDIFISFSDEVTLELTVIVRIDHVLVIRETVRLEKRDYDSIYEMCKNSFDKIICNIINVALGVLYKQRKAVTNEGIMATDAAEEYFKEIEVGL